MSRKWTVSLFLIMAQFAVGVSFGQQYYQSPANVNYPPGMVQHQPVRQAPNYGPAQMAAMQQAYANQMRQAAYFRQQQPDSQRIMAEQKWAQMRNYANAQLAQRQRANLYPAYRQQQPTYQQRQASYQQQQAIYQQRQAAYYQQQPAYQQRPAPALSNGSFVRRSPQQPSPYRYAQTVNQQDPFADLNQDPFADDPFTDQPEVEMQDPFGDPPQDSEQQKPPENAQDPFDDPPAQQPQDPFADDPPEQEPIDPFADPPSDPVPADPETREPTLPGGIDEVRDVPRENQQLPVPPPVEQYPPSVVTPPVVQRAPGAIPPSVAPTTPEARPIAPLQHHPETVIPRPSIPTPSRVGSPEPFIPQAHAGEYAPPIPQSNVAPYYSPEACVPNMQMQSYPQMQPGYVHPAQRPMNATVQRCCPDVSRARNCSCNSCCDSCCELPFYFSVFGGYSSFNSFDEVTNLGVGQNILDFDDGYGVGFALGSEQGFNLRMDIDFAFRQLNLNSLTNRSTPPSSTTGDLNLYSGMGNLYWEFMHFPNQRFKPYVGAGIGFVFLDPNFVSGNAAIPGGSDSSFAYQAMAGLNYKHNYRADLFVEYRYFAADDVSLSSPEVALSEFDLGMNNVFFGIRWKF